MREEERKILQMLQDGKITAEQAEKLLEALKNNAETATKRAKWLRIRVYEGGAEKPTVNINLPLGLLKILLKMGGKFMGGKLTDKIPNSVRERLEQQGIPLNIDVLTPEQVDQLMSALTEEGPLKLVDVDDEESGEKVEITIE